MEQIKFMINSALVDVMPLWEFIATIYIPYLS